MAKITSALTPELIRKMRILISKGARDVDVIKALGLNERTFYIWMSKNVHGIGDKTRQWRQLYMVRAAEQQLISHVQSKNELVAQRAAEFTLERLDKNTYGKRDTLAVESNGPLSLNIISFSDAKDSIPQEKPDKQKLSDSDITS